MTGERPVPAVHLIVNPAAAKGRALRLLPSVRESFALSGINCTVLSTKYPRHATDLVRRLDGRAGMVVALGGDGTVNEVINGLDGTARIFGVIPAGTGDDFARITGIKAPGDILRAIEAQSIRTIDTGEIRFRDAAGTSRRHLFVNTMGIGFDAAVALRVSRRSRGSGIVPYLLAVFQTLRHYRPVPARLSVPTSKTGFASEVFLATVGNGTTSGGGFILSPLAQLDDGLLDLCLVGAIRTGRVLRVLPKTLKGAHLREPEVTYLQSPAFRIELAAPLPIHADGEIITESAHSVEVLARPATLRVLHATG